MILAGAIKVIFSSSPECPKRLGFRAMARLSEPGLGNGVPLFATDLAVRDSDSDDSSGMAYGATHALSCSAIQLARRRYWNSLIRDRRVLLLSLADGKASQTPLENMQVMKTRHP